MALFGFGASFLEYYNFFHSSPPLEQPQKGPQKATLSGFEQEAKEAAADVEGRATAHFKAAEDYYNERHYKNAADEYQQSLVLLKTMSAYLNCGNALSYILELERAETSYHEGLQLARKKKNKTFEASFLNNIGLVYFNQGKYEEALRSYQDALTLYKQLGNPLGLAQDLNNIGTVYFNQGKYKEALRFYQDALTLHKQLGNLLGLAKALGNIGTVYADQGKIKKALECLTQAQALYLQLGLNTRGLQSVEQTLNRLRSASKDRLE